MQFRLEIRHWRPLSWWLAVLSVALLLKHHYSVATAADLEWVLRPLSLLLEWFSGHAFHSNASYEWVSESANVRLVKACAGINFMLMSFIAYAWNIRPGQHAAADPWSWIAGRTVLLSAAIAAAWATCLLANALRILIAMAVESEDAGVHRLIGMLTYAPLLSLQLTLGDRSDYRAALAGPALLYLLLTVLVPLLTGNAFRNPSLFVEHLLYLALLVTVCGGVGLLLSRLESSR